MSKVTFLRLLKFWGSRGINPFNWFSVFKRTRLKQVRSLFHNILAFLICKKWKYFLLRNFQLPWGYGNTYRYALSKLYHPIPRWALFLKMSSKSVHNCKSWQSSLKMKNSVSNFEEKNCFCKAIDYSRKMQQIRWFIRHRINPFQIFVWYLEWDKKRLASFDSLCTKLLRIEITT